MNKRFEKKVVMIIGATGGIGSAVARAFSKEGANLVLFGRDIFKLQELQFELKSPTQIAKGDATIFTDLVKAVELAEENYGSLDIVIHAVGSIVLRSILALTEEQFRETLDLNLISPFLSAKAALAAMLKNKKGSFVFLSSVAGSTGLINHEAISAAKGGLDAFIRSAAMTYAKKGIRFNSVALGLVQTPLADFLTKNEIALNASKALHPMNRIGNPSDVVEAVLYLASDEASWTTGVILPVDGGMAAGKG